MAKSNKTPRPVDTPSDLLVMFLIAEGFWGLVQSAHNESPGDAENIFKLVGCVNLAFSLELHIKCLTAIEGGAIMGTHDLDFLFGRLEPETQVRAEQIYDEVRATDPQCVRDREFLLQQGENPEETFALRIALEKSANAFDDLRYAFESEIDTHFTLNPLLIAIRRIILERKPEWVHYLDYASDGPQ